MSYRSLGRTVGVGDGVLGKKYNQSTFCFKNKKSTTVDNKYAHLSNNRSYQTTEILTGAVDLTMSLIIVFSPRGIYNYGFNGMVNNMEFTGKLISSTAKSKQTGYFNTLHLSIIGLVNWHQYIKYFPDLAAATIEL